MYTILCENPEDGTQVDAKFNLTLVNMTLDDGKTDFKISLAPGQSDVRHCRRIKVFEDASFSYSVVYMPETVEYTKEPTDWRKVAVATPVE